MGRGLDHLLLIHSMHHSLFHVKIRISSLSSMAHVEAIRVSKDREEVYLVPNLYLASYGVSFHGEMCRSQLLVGLDFRIYEEVN